MSLNKFTVQKSFAINAGAGSGKTYTLSRRYINALVGFDYFREDYSIQESFFETLKPARVKEIVTITYTEAAALEMKGRIFELVSKIINFKTLDSEDGDYKSIQEANSHITDTQKQYVLNTLKEAYQSSSNSKISTIHSFCLDIIKANADIAKIDVKLNIIKEDEKQSELSSIIFEVLNTDENKETILDISKDINMFFITGLIEKYTSNSKFRKDYDSFDKESISQELYKKLIYELFPLPQIDDAFNELSDDKVRLEWFSKFYQNILDFKAVDWKEVIENQKAPSMGEKKYPFADEAKKKLEKVVRIYQTIDEEKENIFFQKIEKLKSLLHTIKAKYDTRLLELGKIDFDTIISKTLEIIPKVNTNFKYIMVDEFQDTNETQFEIVKNAMNKDTNLFAVGDSKQSIYSFQGAEIEVFNNAVNDTSLFSSIEPMSKNHRSDGVVLDKVNSIFDKVLAKNSSLKLISQNYEADPQELQVFKESRKEKGSFEFLITANPYKGEKDELDTIANFVSDICYGKNSKYLHISELVKDKKKAIAIIYDSSTKMLELKSKLKERGIFAKVSASDNFYHTKEVNDIYNTLKAIDIVSKKQIEFTPKERFYLVGAMRSNILKIDDNSIKKYLESHQIPPKLQQYCEEKKGKTFSEFIKYIYDDANLFGVYAHFDDVEQRVANLYKFLQLALEYQNSNESNLYKFLKLLENGIYFSDAKEDEAFYKSENAKSVEICSIHSTKGLAYPLVLLGYSEKALYSQVTSDSLKHNNFTVNGMKKEIVGFKINKYEPLALRVLKSIDKLKHLAEKKRLLYVALTRAEYDVVISAKLSETKDGQISKPREDSYLSMIIDSLGIEPKTLFLDGVRGAFSPRDEVEVQNQSVTYEDHQIKPIEFIQKEKLTATSGNETIDDGASLLGTITHKIFELYWDRLETIDSEQLFSKFEIYDDESKSKIKKSIDNFLQSEVYKKLQNGAKHKFELEFHTNDKRGFIDLVYFEEDKNGWVIVDFKTGSESKDKEAKYQKQLEFYRDVLIENGYVVVDMMLLWV